MSISNLWQWITAYYYNDKKLVNNRGGLYKRLYKDFDSSFIRELTLIDNPYYAVGGIWLYRALVDKTSKIKIRRIREGRCGWKESPSISEVRDYWTELVKELAYSVDSKVIPFYRFQTYLTSILIYVYLNNLDCEDGTDIKSTNIVRLLKWFKRNPDKHISRPHLYAIYMGGTYEDILSMRKTGSEGRAKKIYDPAIRIHDFLSTLNLAIAYISDIEVLRRYMRKQEKKVLFVGVPVEITITVPGLYLETYIERVEAARQEGRKIDLREIYDDIKILETYYIGLQSYCDYVIKESRNNPRAGLPYYDRPTIERYLSASTDIIKGIGSELAYEIIRREVESTILWRAHAAGYRVDLNRFMDGYLRLIK